jgi:hypothetical protein
LNLLGLERLLKVSYSLQEHHGLVRRPALDVLCIRLKLLRTSDPSIPSVGKRIAYIYERGVEVGFWWETWCIIPFLPVNFLESLGSVGIFGKE